MLGLANTILETRTIYGNEDALQPLLTGFALFFSGWDQHDSGPNQCNPDTPAYTDAQIERMAAALGLNGNDIQQVDDIVGIFRSRGYRCSALP